MLKCIVDVFQFALTETGRRRRQTETGRRRRQTEHGFPDRKPEVHCYRVRLGFRPLGNVESLLPHPSLDVIDGKGREAFRFPDDDPAFSKAIVVLRIEGLVDEPRVFHDSDESSIGLVGNGHQGRVVGLIRKWVLSD